MIVGLFINTDRLASFKAAGHVRDTSADCHWSTRPIDRAINTQRDHIYKKEIESNCIPPMLGLLTKK